tara:strand:- start:20 stop:820 length:801 start_codon:yes stop_codon:yes gene_type:complete
MNNFLAVGSSQLGGFLKGFRLFDEKLAEKFDYAAVWETGFGYLNLESDGFIRAPDFVPKVNNPSKRNIQNAWAIRDSSGNKGLQRVPCIHHYKKIFIVASPCKFFAPFYYPINSPPSLLSASVLKSCFASWQIDKQFESISPWHFRISPIIRQLIRSCPEKVVFIGAPLPLENLETRYFERLRDVLMANTYLRDVHLQNIESIRCFYSRHHVNSVASYDVVLPPEKLLCDLKLTTHSMYATKESTWHAGSEYWRKIVSRIVDVYVT